MTYFIRFCRITCFFLIVGLIALLTALPVFAQTDSTDCIDRDSLKVINDRLDSLYIEETEGMKGPEKVLHAEPLYIDLIRDLGARKGEREWNVGMGLTDRQQYDRYEMLVEYEFAPVNRLGVEFELPFTWVPGANGGAADGEKSRLHSVKAAIQWSFYVSEKRSVSMALGYINEMVLFPFERYRKRERMLAGNVFNPFGVIAKRWGQNVHTLIYTGPHIDYTYAEQKSHFDWRVNTNLHYLLPGTRNFIGLEINKIFSADRNHYILRPQMRLGLAHNLLVGLVSGIPVSRERERLSLFIRLIYEPGLGKQVRH